MPHLHLRGSRLHAAPIKAVLFDKDGTMSHSEPMLEALAAARIGACLELAAGHGFATRELTQLRELLERAYGFGPAGVHPAGSLAVASRLHNLIVTATCLAQMDIGWPEALAISEESFAHTDGMHGQGSRFQPQPTPGLIRMLDGLMAAGVRCAVISNDHEDGIRGFLQAHGLNTHVAAIWSADHHPCKPHPGAVHGLCAAMGIQPGQCALIGDANSDLRMARSAGVAVVLGYRSGWRQPPPLDADFPLLDHWDELEVAVATPPANNAGISS
jgi:phosphoglycolate phosphatase